MVGGGPDDLPLSGLVLYLHDDGVDVAWCGHATQRAEPSRELFGVDLPGPGAGDQRSGGLEDDRQLVSRSALAESSGAGLDSRDVARNGRADFIGGGAAPAAERYRLGIRRARKDSNSAADRMSGGPRTLPHGGADRPVSMPRKKT